MELADVPFYAQSRYQCGPAALATALGASGVTVAPDALTDEVYVPGRRGSFQVELAAAARRRGRIPYRIPESLDGLHAELAAGRPVLVLQNLAFGWAPRWHYAVVVGIEPDRQRIVLRSGRTERQVQRLADFDRTWALAERWGLVVLRPGELPARGDPRDYLAAVVAAGANLTADEQAQALDAGRVAWPLDADLPFAAANLARSRGDEHQAVALYRGVLSIAPDHVGTLNNLADLLSARGCQRAAMVLIERGLAAAGDGSALTSVLETTRAEIVARSRRGQLDGADCPEPGY
ncbi:MAG: PA2778 family cysteine peptidase [Pseudomonadales bacterium]